MSETCEIKIDELCKRIAAKVRSTMDEAYSDDLIGYGWQVNEEDWDNSYE